MGTIFKRQEVQEERMVFLILEYGSNGLSRNAGKNYHSTLRNIPEKRSHLHRGGSLKSRKKNSFHAGHVLLLLLLLLLLLFASDCNPIRRI
jgi:hypothetical protein